MRRRLARAALLAAPALLLPGCGGSPGSRVVVQDLLAARDEADLRADFLSLEDLAADPLFEARGWSPLERGADGVLAWTVGRSARLRLPFRSAADKELRLVARAHESLGPALPLSLALNGAPLAAVELGTEPSELRLPLPGSAQLEGDNVLVLATPRHREPAAGEADRRRLAVAVAALEVRPLGDARSSGPAVFAGGGLVLPPGSAAGWYVRLARNATVALRAGPGPSGRLAVRLETDAGSHELLPETGARPGPASVAVGLPAGTIGRLEVASLGEGAVRLEELRLAGELPREPTAAALAGSPSLLVYLVDTLRADRLGPWGHDAPTSPELDRFAAKSLLFEDAWAQASWTRPATASLMTGLHPTRHGADREDTALARGRTTLAELLAARGYRTGAWVANHLVGERFGFAQGFASFNDGDDALYSASAETLGRRALAWLDAGEEPFFAYVHTMEPHSPYEPPPEAAAPFALEGYDGSRDTRALLRLGQLGELPPEGLAFLESRYRGEIRENDRAFGLLLEGLRERGLLESTLVVFLSDHGEELLDHGGTEHAKTLYQELVRLPLAVRLPGALRGGARVAAPVQHVDLMPTLLSLLGVPPPEGLGGRDLSGRWLAPEPGDPGPAPLLFAEERFTVTDKLAVRAGPLKLILNNDGPELWRAGAHVELYDLAADPGERRNVAPERPIATAYLRQELERFRREQAALAEEPETLELSDEDLDQLRALGYVQ